MVISLVVKKELSFNCASGCFTKALIVPDDVYMTIMCKRGTPKRLQIMRVENESHLCLNLVKTLDKLVCDSLEAVCMCVTF